jgi:phenylpyruvate tautomerase PptA (4-oxalocrotonate tautomerase family)
MPTYVCSVLENSVDDRQKEAIAEAISRIHAEETGAPNFFCQIVIEEKNQLTGFSDRHALRVRYGSEVTFEPGERKNSGPE